MGDRTGSSSTTSSDTTTATTTDKQSASNANNGSSARTFRIPSQSGNVLQELNRQRLEGEFCDITVLVEHKRFSAHKCVLAANSPYFKNLLSTDNDGVFLRHITAISFESIVDFMYTSRLQLEATTVQDILSAAKFLQVRGVVSICCRYLESQIRNLARDLDNHKKEKKHPTNISVEADSFKQGHFQALLPIQQQQLHSTYDPAAAVFDPQTNMASYGGPGLLMNDSINQQIFPLQPPAQALPNDHNQHSNQSQHPMRAFKVRDDVTYRNREYNSNFDGLGNQHELPNGDFQRTFLPLVHGNPTGIHSPDMEHQSIRRSHMQPWRNSMYTPSFIPFQNQMPPHQSNSSNQFGVESHYPNQRAMITSQANPNFNSGHFYTSQSAGGKGRRQPPQIGRKGMYGAVSDTHSHKFTSASPKLTLDSVVNNSLQQTSKNRKNVVPSEAVVMISSARSEKNGREKRVNSPDTIAFDIEAEDRYWDALSTRRILDSPCN